MKTFIRRASVVGAAFALWTLLACPIVVANPVEFETDWTFEMTDSDTALVFEFTSFGEEENEEVVVEWKNGDEWLPLPAKTWEKSGTTTVSGSGETWVLDRVARKIPCPGEGDWSFRLAIDPGPEHPMAYPLSETAGCAGPGANASEYYDLDDDTVESCSAAPSARAHDGLFSILSSLL